MAESHPAAGRPSGAGAAFLRATEGDPASQAALAKAQEQLRRFRRDAEALMARARPGACLAALQSALLDWPTLQGALAEALEQERPYIEAELRREAEEWASFGIEMPRSVDDWIVLASAAGMTFTETESASLDAIRLYAIGAKRRAAFAQAGPPTALTAAEAALLRALARLKGRRMLPMDLDTRAPAPAEPKRLRSVLRELHARGLVDYPERSRAGVCITKLGLEALREYGED